MKEQIAKLKLELKELALQIKTQKPEYKQSQRACSLADSKDPKINDLWRDRSSKFYSLYGSKNIYRHKHIAYCLLRGRTIEQIENKNREGNGPNMTFVNKIMKEAQDAQALCDSAKQPV